MVCTFMSGCMLVHMECACFAKLFGFCLHCRDWAQCQRKLIERFSSVIGDIHFNKSNTVNKV